ncbi:hypothetical protein [Mitsuaria sp. GD03876]|uniref:hypothetical protein n=1 Tax=Mitsuaria sp. GD03876 TaxID=2975399 RepID=UPI00244AE810|nr:hypothetical protein [Mitsuaria sp. GD03876]MDH0864710.1 hypothetical protein [Mitsuaria sp. GD03876]
MSRAFGTGRRRTDVALRLGEGEALRVLAAVHAECVGEGAAIPLTQLPVWVHFQGCLPALSVRPMPVEAAIARLETATGAETGLRLTCHKLLEHWKKLDPPTQGRPAVRAVLALLRRIPGWYEWSAVAEDALARTQDRDLLPMIESWIPGQLDQPVPRRLLLQALQLAGPGESGLHRLALGEVIAVTPTLTPDWSRIAVVLFASEWARPDLLRWMAPRHAQLAMAHLLVTAIELDQPHAVEWATAWAQAHHLEFTANRVLELLSERSTDVRVVAWATAWLERRHPHSSFLLRRLIELAPERARAIGVAWLASTSFEQKGWSYVWGAMWSRWTGDAHLKEVAIQWMAQTSPSHPGWGHFWRQLFEFDPEDEQLWRQGIDRLAAPDVAPGHAKRWYHVWRIMWKKRPRDPELVARSVPWLKTVSLQEACSVWATVWVGVNGSGLAEPLVDLALAWLKQAPPEDMSWQHVWGRLWDRTPGDVALAAMALDWLRKAPSSHLSWPFAWRSLWDATPDDPVLIALGARWLDLEPHSNRAFKVATALGRS